MNEHQAVVPASALPVRRDWTRAFGLRDALLCLAALGITGRSAACGHCIEDRVAVVYDYAVEQAARRDGLSIAYLGVEGGPPGAQVERTLRTTPGVVAGSVRIAADPPAAAFAWTARETPLEPLLDRINAALVAEHRKLTLLRTWDVQSGLH